MSQNTDFPENFTRGIDLVMDFSAGTQLEAKAFRSCISMRKKSECDLDSDVLSPAESTLRATFASQVFSPHSDTTGDEEMRAAAQMFKEKIAVVSARRAAAAE